MADIGNNVSVYLSVNISHLLTWVHWRKNLFEDGERNADVVVEIWTS